MTRVQGGELPRVPLKASIDLTYRCNNRCRHCWLWTADTPEERARELTTDDWREVIDQSRALGVREWAISGGEPMLREDFSEIFEYATSRSRAYSLNTNGTLITPQIAHMLKCKGNKMIAVYGATAEVYDHVTRKPGGFEALLQGLAYLKEAGAGFTVQLIPMRDNWGQWDEMIAFAEAWSKHWRVGAPWLFMTAGGDPERNAEIERQRLDPADVVALSPPEVAAEELRAGGACESLLAERSAREECAPSRLNAHSETHADCVRECREFHVDSYGSMSFCGFVKDARLRSALRVDGAVPAGAIRTGWEGSIPSLSGIDLAEGQHRDDCGFCELRADCRWCDAYGYLEHGLHGASVEHLCAVARASHSFTQAWLQDHRRYYEIAGMTVQVESDLPFVSTTLASKFESFRAAGPGPDMVYLKHHFGLPHTDDTVGAEEVYRQSPWAIYRKKQTWLYLGIPPQAEDESLARVAAFNNDHTAGVIFNDSAGEQNWRRGGLHSLTMFPSDQILLARLLADRRGCMLHSGGIILDGQGLLFIGHSEAGKSTVMTMFRRQLGHRVEILCDDRNIVRLEAGGARVHGTWSHGDVPDVSSASADLRAILFLQQDVRNEIEALTDRKVSWRRLLATLIRPMVTADWWEKEIDVLEAIVRNVPCYTMHFDKGGTIVSEVERLLR